MSAKLQQPHSVEAEKSLLGALFLEPDLVHALDVEPRDFYVAKHRSVYQCIVRLVSKGIVPDLVTVCEDLKKSEEFDADGGPAPFTAELVDFTPTAANAKYYVRILKDKANARRIYKAASDLAKLSNADEMDVDQRNAMALAIIEEATADHSGQSDLLTVDQLADIYQAHVAKLGKSRFGTGWPDLDGVIRGVAPGEVMMITAYSGLFKSAILQNMLLNGCQRTGEHHLFFSIEMPAARVFERTCQIGLESGTYNIESGFHNRDGFKERTVSELRAIGADKLIICDRARVTIEQVEHLARQARARYGSIGAIGIDYLGLMGADGKEREYDRISYVAENSKHLAKRLNVPVIILTQIDRTSAREGKVEKFSAKGSGAIEASADYMIGLEKDDQKRLVLKLLKNRNGEENLKFLVDIEAKYLKVRGVTAYDDIAAKNVARGKERVRREFRDDPQGYDPY